MSENKIIPVEKKSDKQGMYMIIVAMIGLIGVLSVNFFKKSNYKEYCKPGGLWISADNNMICNIFEKKDSFNIQIQNSFTGWVLQGNGQFNSGLGMFTAIDFDSENENRKGNKYIGELSLQGCNNLSVSFWEKSRKNRMITFSYVRGSRENIKLMQEDK